MVEIDIQKVLTDALRPLVEAMVDHPEEVKIKIEKSQYNTVFVYMTARRGDVGKVIGREGRHASAIRVLVSAIGSKFKFRTIVEINPEDDQS
jgi:predicted RNA-binding protein YlqC (UPF0109 family)